MGCPLAEGGSHFPPQDPGTVPCPLTGCLSGGRVLSSGWSCRTAAGVFSQAAEASSSDSFLLGTHDSGVCLEWVRVAASSQGTLPPGGSRLGLCGHCMASPAVGRLSVPPAPFPQGQEVIPPRAPPLGLTATRELMAVTTVAEEMNGDVTWQLCGIVLRLSQLQV